MVMIRQVLIFSLICCSLADYVPFDELYAEGLSSYGEERWKDAISSFEQAIASYKQYKNGLSKCHRKCKSDASENPVVDQTSLGKIASKAACTRDCLDGEFGDYRLIGRILPEVKQSFEDLLPYQYLQYTYYQEGMLAKSVSAAYTFSLRFPENEMMKGNMDFFRDNSEVTNDMYINMESKPHLDKYNDAVQSYLKEDYKSATKYFEEALQEYFIAVDDCHALCDEVEESNGDQIVDFYRQNADHYYHVVECTLKCIQELPSEVAGQNDPNFVPRQYHYLQFAYYQTNNIEKAAECAKSYLTFHPNDTVVKNNLLQFSRDIDINNIQARKEALSHFKRLTIETLLLEYIYQNFGYKDYDVTLFKPFGDITTDDEDHENEETVVNEEEETSYEEPVISSTQEQKDAPYESMKEKTDDIIDKKDIAVELKLAEAAKKQRDELHYLEPTDDVDISQLRNSQAGYRVIDSKYVVTIDQNLDEDPLAEGPIMYEGTVLLANSSQLKGRERFAVDALATENHCQQLIDLEVSFGRPGDGYKGRVSPHTENELFEGLSLLKTAKMAKEGLLSLSSAMLYYDLSEKVRALVQAYFKLPHLYFSFTHLVCRTAKADSPADRNDLSHPVHADNCILKDDGECVKKAPAFTWRDYSAILYLNTGFVGGEFIFTDSTARRVRTMVKPKCGRMVSFEAGTFHGVKPVLSGRRCAVALWFTLSKEKEERERIKAKLILDDLVSRQKDEL